ncbi:phosphatase PAP2 family protein [Streptomyces sp. NPDC087440]|uniref:phosphatase PAP2 family protein n=1 Tax=Streptomyces sp. NPDC087440 TaxID=3365790 RepID=UPI00380080C9
MSPPPPLPARPRRTSLRAGLGRTAAYLLAFAVLHGLAVWTPVGQRAENALVVGYADQARIFPWAQSWGPPPLTHEIPLLAVGLALVVTIAVVRRRLREGCAAVATVVGTLAVTELLSKVVLVRPDLVGAAYNLREASFPSGHVAISAALALGLVLVVPGQVRFPVAAVGAVWVALTAGAVQALYWHRPSDVLGAVLPACAAFTVAAGLLGPGAAVGGTRPRLRHVMYVLPVAAAVAVLAASREDAVARPLVFAGAALVCAVLVLAAVVRSPSAPRVQDMPVPGATAAAPGNGTTRTRAPGGAVRPEPGRPARG